MTDQNEIEAQKELEKLKKEEKKRKKNDKWVSWLILAFMAGLLIGASLGVYTGYIQGQNVMWEMAKSVVLYVK